MFWRGKQIGFTDTVELKRIKGTKKFFRTLNSLKFVILGFIEFTVPKGTKTDGASVPWIGRWWVSV